MSRLLHMILGVMKTVFEPFRKLPLVLFELAQCVIVWTCVVWAMLRDVVFLPERSLVVALWKLEKIH